MRLTGENYYGRDANREYMSVSQYKEFAGTYGMAACEAAAMARIRGEWEEKPNAAMMVGSYVDRYFEGTLDSFKEEHPEMFRRDGGLRAEYAKAEQIIERVSEDGLFMRYMSGEKQAIMTGEIGGAEWKIKMDSYIPGVAIVDLKVMKSLTKKEWVRDIGYLDFVQYWGYDIQGAVYQEIVRQNTGKRLPFYIAGVSKESEPNIEVINVTDSYLREALDNVVRNMPRILRVKSGAEPPDRCGRCGFCRRTKVLTSPIRIADLAESI